MIQRTVRSPAGEIIEVMGDAEWVKLTGVSERGLNLWNAGSKRFIVAALWEHGVFSNSSGRAISDMLDWIYETYGVEARGGSITTMIRDPINVPAFKRVTPHVKRTHSIQLIALPEIWYSKLMDTLAIEIQHGRVLEILAPEPQPEPIPDEIETPTDQEWANLTSALELDAPTIYDSEPVINLDIASSVAMSLLTHVVEIIHAGSPEATDARVRQLKTEFDDVAEKLSKRLEENNVMRRQLRQAGDDLQALRIERDGLRSRLRSTENNLSEILRGDQAKLIDAEVSKRIERFMNAKPESKHVKDDA